jgi:hypothetical protein
MKLYIAILSMLALAAGSVVGGISYLFDTAPPLELSQAFPVAVTALGTNAAQYHCVMACPMKIQGYYTNHTDGWWSFNFVATNGMHKTVWVFFDDKTTAIPNFDHSAGF